MHSGIKFETNVDVVVKQLRMAGIAIQEAGADALNMAATAISTRYKKNLKSKKRLRNEKFSLGSVMIFKASGKKGKTLRSFKDINAIVGIKTLRDGTHYLATMEVGGQKTGNQKTGRKVPIPLTTARGGNIKNPIIPKYRLSSGGTVAQYQGVLRSATNARQEYAILYSLARSGRIRPGMYQSDSSIYNVTSKQVVMLRRVKDTVVTKPSPLFESASMMITQGLLDNYFLKSANKRIRALG